MLSYCWFGEKGSNLQPWDSKSPAPPVAPSPIMLVVYRIRSQTLSARLGFSKFHSSAMVTSLDHRLGLPTITQSNNAAPCSQHTLFIANKQRDVNKYIGI